MAKKKDEIRIHDLFPYKIKSRKGLYNRDHPENLRPDSPKYKEYWADQFQKVIEGWWVFDKAEGAPDDEGVWIFMMPKLYFYINIAKISDTKEGNKAARAFINPRLRDNELITFTYILCTQGFSGFEGDLEFTCYEDVGKLQRGEHVISMDIEEIPTEAYKEDGSYKTYIDPWTYLTRHYLIDNPAKKPLGLPLYDNPIYNALTLSSRGTGKSLMYFVGDLMHEFLTGGIRRWKDAKDMLESALLFFAGSSDEKKMNKTLRMVKIFYDNMPGSFTTINAKGEEEYTPSPFYRKLRGSWSLGSALMHQYKKRDGRDVGSKSMIELNSIHTPNVATGDRYSMVMVEELGLLKIMMQFYDFTKDSLEVNGLKTGRMIGLGTGGDIERIQEAKLMFTNPKGYDVFSIPNYWENENNRIGLFIPVQYRMERYKDENGNTILDKAHEAAFNEAEEKRKHSTAKSYKSHILNNPFIPSQIFQSSSYSVYPSEEAIRRLVEIETNDLWRKKAAVGTLTYSSETRYGIKFEPDLEGKLVPITKYLGFDIEKDDTEGAFAMYEPPPDVIPHGLYKLSYDPVAKDGTGTSLNSVLVYKGLNKGDNSGMSNNIVAEWIGRTATLVEAYEMVYKMSRYYNAKIFPEVNVPGFTDWVKKVKKQSSILQSEASHIEKEIFTNYKHVRGKVGFRVRGNRGQMNFFLDQLINDWLLEDADWDEETGNVTKRVIDTLYSTRLLEEIAYYDEDNFDHISSLRGIVMWMANERKSVVYEVKSEEELEEEQQLNKDKKFMRVRTRKPNMLN